MSAILLVFSRSGGRPPADDELLELRADGTYLARRTVGGARIGTFADRLGVEDMATIGGEVAVCRSSGAMWLETPRDGATETISLGEDGEAGASLGSNARPAGPWGTLVNHLRLLIDQVADHPMAALELVADTGHARLVAIGVEPFDLDGATIACSVTRILGSGVPVDRWGSAAVDPATTPPAWQRVYPGWSYDLPFDHGIDLGPGDWLQVRTMVTIRADATRRGRLFVAVSGG